jgi:cell wall-associated NlpC family hydrolase
MAELEILGRAHALFAGESAPARLDAGTDDQRNALTRTTGLNTGGGQDRYQHAVQSSRESLRTAVDTDARFAGVIARAQQDHALARQLTRQVLEAAHADATTPTGSPVAQREAMRRRAARLRAQHNHVSAARRRALRRLVLLRALRYRSLQGRRRLGDLRLPPPSSRAGIAVRAALSRLGKPYVWGATGPNQFDCSGLVQWSYHQAGIQLDRTTYAQINAGVPVPRSQIQPGDLIFPHSGHVQMAIGNGLVVEAPHAGATVRIGTPRSPERIEHWTRRCRLRTPPPSRGCSSSTP